MSFDRVLTGEQTWHVETTDVLAGLRSLPDGCVHCCVTSPPYFSLRDYGVDGQLGLEKSPYCFGWVTGAPCGECFCCVMTAVFREVRRVLRDDGTCFLNIGDSWNAGTAKKRTTSGPTQNKQHGYWMNADIDHRVVHAESKPKDMLGVPWALAFALRADGWWLRSEIIWSKRSPMPESVRRAICDTTHRGSDCKNDWLSS